MIDQRESINIRDLAIPEPTPATGGGFLEFDPHKEFSSADMDWAVEDIKNRLHPAGIAEEVIHPTAQLITLFPDEKGRFEGLVLPYIEDYLNRIDSTPGLSAVYRKLLFPETPVEDLYGSFPKKMVEDALADSEKGFAVAKHVLDAFVFYPHEAGTLAQELPGIAPALEAAIQRSEERPGTTGSQITTDNILTLSVSQRLLFGRDGVTMSKESWDDMEKYRAGLKAQSPSSYVRRTFQMALVSATDIRMTPDGMRMRWDFGSPPTTDQPSLPTARKF